MKKRIINQTLEIENSNPIDIDEYPFKQCKRNSYLSLNGKWDLFIFENEKQIEHQIIEVPSCLKSKLTGHNLNINERQTFIYHKEFIVKDDFIKDLNYLNILGIDQEYEILLNNESQGKFYNLMVPIKVKLNSLKKGKNILKIIVRDHNLNFLPRGKQSTIPKGMFYTSTEGIYFPIFIESLKENHIKSFKITADLNSIHLEVNSPIEYNIKIYDQNDLIVSKSFNQKIIDINIPTPKLWSFQNPFLYKLIIENENDKIESYFALRTIHVDKENQYIYLNDERIFINGLLDQGYYLDGIQTPKSYYSYLNDLITIKKLGFNAIRKHIKIECDYFYYLCDKLGILVIQDLVNNGDYSFFKETLLPTIFPKYQILARERKRHFLEKYYFLKHAKKTFEYLYNHPCIIMYTIFNEGWGQFNSNKVYQLIKKYEPNRIIDLTSGWFRKANSDITSLHIYFRKISKVIKKQKKPIFLSEFGGYVYKVENHTFNLNNSYGYKNITSLSSYQQNLFDLYHNDIYKNIDAFSGIIYTQICDVEDEINGIMTYDRKFVKIKDENLIKLIHNISNYPQK